MIDAKADRDQAKADGTEAVNTADAKNSEVEAAIDAYNKVVANADQGEATTEDIAKATEVVKAADGAATNAEKIGTIALNQIANPVGNEDTVKAANQKLADALNAANPSTTAIKAATTAYNQAIVDAKADRQAAIDAGKKIADKAPADADVQKAVQNFNDVVNASTDENATTADVNAAADALQKAIDAAAAARAVKVTTDPYSLETEVKTAQANLDSILTDPTSGTTAIQQATAALQQAVNTAAAKRTATLDEGETITKSAPALAVQFRHDIAAAIAVYNSSVARAADDKDVTQTIQEALDALKIALAKIQAAIDVAKNTTTAEVGQEPEVAAAKQALDNLLASDSTASAEDIQKATDALNNATQAATTERTDVVTAGDDTVTTVTDTGYDANDDIATAIKAYEEAKANAATGAVDADTSAKLAEATANLVKAQTTLNNAIETAKNTVSDPYGKDAVVVTAQNALDSLLADKSSSATAIAQATADLNAAVTQTTPVREAAVTAGTTATKQAQTDGMAQEPEVAQAIADFNDVTAEASGNNASTEDVQAAADALQKALDAAATKRQTVIADGDATQTTATTQAVAQEPEVAKAIAAYEDAKTKAAEGTATTADIAKAAEALQNAIDGAETQRQTTIKDGDATKTTATTNAVAQEPDVVKAIAAYEDAKTKAAEGVGTTADIAKAAEALQDAIDGAETQRQTTIKNGDATKTTATTDAVAQEPEVAKAIAAYEDAKTKAAEGTATTADIAKAAEDLQNAIDSAETQRQTTIKNGDATKTTATTNAVAQEPEVAKAIAAYEDAKTKAADGTGTTADIVKAAEALQDAIDGAETQRQTTIKNGDATKTTATTNAVAQEPDVAKAIAAYEDAKNKAAEGVGTTANIAKAAEALQDAIDGAETQRQTTIKNGDATQTTATTEAVAQEPEVTKAIAAYEDAKNKAAEGSATTADIAKAAQNLQDAIDGAETQRQTTIKNGDATKTTATTNAVAQEPDVAKAIAAYEDAKNKAAEGVGTTADIAKAAEALQSAIDGAETTRQTVVKDGDATKTTATTNTVAQEPEVTKAIATYDKVKAQVAAGTATTADLQAATEAVSQAITTAVAKREAVLKQGSQLIKQAENSSNAGVADALATYQQVVRQAQQGLVTTSQLQAAITVLGEAIEVANQTGQPRTALPATDAEVPATSSAVASKAQATAPTHATLPQTGESTNALGTIGLAITGLFGILGLAKKRREDQD